MLSGPATAAVHGPHTHLCSKKKKGKQRKKGKSFKAETIKRLSPRSKCYCFSHSRASRIKKFFSSASHGGRQYFSVLLFSATVPWPLHIEIHFAGPGCGGKLMLKTFVTILFFTFWSKTGNFAVLICYAVPVPANKCITTQK